MKAQRAYLYKDIAALERRVATLLTTLSAPLNPLSPTRTAPASRPPPTEINSITNNRWGGVVGGGAEWAVGG